ncbi:MAG: hypothetical protein AB7W47_14360 [Calditrichaceae bacterium]
MIKVKIGGIERDYDKANESWISQQINRRREDGIAVCVTVIVNDGDLNFILSTPTCGNTGGGRRPLRSDEKIILELWNQRGLNKPDFTGGNLIAFLKQLKKML